MKKETIMNNYAIKQGYECWWELLHYCMKNGNVQYHIDKVTDLIQEELKKKIHYEYQENISKDWYDSTKLKDDKVILKTEIL